jgi:hypothetical protein
MKSKTGNQWRKISETKSWYFEKTDNLLGRVRKRERT